MMNQILGEMCNELETYFGGHGFPGFGLAVGHRGTVFYTAARGQADPLNKRPMTADTPMRLGSLSKVFTAAAILKLKQEGRLGLQDSLKKYFPRCDAVSDKPNDPDVLNITIKQILNHTAGFPSEAGLFPYMAEDQRWDFYARPENLTYETVCRYVYSCKLIHRPGEKAAYSTIAYLILGRIIEQVAGKPYAVYLREAVLDPAGVSGVAFGSTDERGRARDETAYHSIQPLESGTALRETEFQMGRCRHLECRDSSGGLIASPIALIDAMMRFYETTGVGLFELESRRDLVSPPEGSADPAPQNYTGLGWWIRRPAGFEEQRNCDPLHMTKLGHTGRTSGAVSLLFRGENGVWAAVQANAGVRQEDWLTLQWAVLDIVAPRIRSLDVQRLHPETARSAKSGPSSPTTSPRDAVSSGAMKTTVPVDELELA